MDFNSVGFIRFMTTLKRAQNQQRAGTLREMALLVVGDFPINEKRLNRVRRRAAGAKPRGSKL